VLNNLVEGARLLAYAAGLILLIGAISHVLAWVLTRQRTARWVWRAWNVVGAGLLAAGTAAIAYGWWGYGLHTGVGSALAGLGLLLASAGLWMIVPI
jgi:hypothetical protein